MPVTFSRQRPADNRIVPSMQPSGPRGTRGVMHPVAVADPADENLHGVEGRIKAVGRNPRTVFRLRADLECAQSGMNLLADHDSASKRSDCGGTSKPLWSDSSTR